MLLHHEKEKIDAQYGFMLQHILFVIVYYSKMVQGREKLELNDDNN